ncbi:MAG: 39S ribosomal protein L46, mitochondrial [Icmadophila ericetorum]|nr:39S ribosomal protein L46, mitochondrial [Icmadophila ericetorum]
MARGLARPRRLASQIRPSLFPNQIICKNCLSAIQHRNASTATAEATPSSEPSNQPPSLSTSTTPQTTPYLTHLISAGILLSRPPLLTRPLTPFEKSYFLYNRRLNERLALPFSRYFYYPKGTPEDVDWKRKIKDRKTAAREIGVYSGYGEEAWNDEVLVGAMESEPEWQVERLVKDAEDVGGSLEGEEGNAAAAATGTKKGVVEKPLPRETEADRTGDMQSLNRALARTLYLVVQGPDGKWCFPSAPLTPGESLSRAAERIMVQSCGPNMNTWVVGNAPVGHYSKLYKTPQTITTDEKRGPFERLGEKTFFMKVRMMAGQANLSGNLFGLQDFKWLAKEEVEREVGAGKYWNAVRNMLAER